MSTATTTDISTGVIDTPATAVVCRDVTKEFGDGDSQSAWRCAAWTWTCTAAR